MKQVRVEVYGTPTCGPCRQVEQYLKDRGIPYTKYDVSQDEEAQERLMSLGSTSVPTIVVNGTEVIIGFNRDRLAALLQ